MQDAQQKPSKDTLGKNAVSLDPGVQFAIGRQLRAMFDDVAHEPVPDRFLHLLSELERRQKGR